MLREHLTWLALALAGCGRIGFDATGNDRGQVQVTTIGFFPRTGDAPLANVPLVITDAAGVMQDVVVSPTDRVTLDIERGWSITALFPSDALNGNAQAQTIVAVEPGDSLQFVAARGGTPPTLLDQMTIDTGVIGSYVWSPCGFGSGGAQRLLSRFSHCPETSFDALVTSYAGTPQYSVVPVTWSAGGTVTVSSYLPADTLDFSVSGLPPETSSGSLSLQTLDDASWLESPQTKMYAIAGGQIAGTFAVQRVLGDRRDASWHVSRADQAVESGISGSVVVAMNETNLSVTHVPIPWIANTSFDFVEPALTVDTIGAGTYRTTTFDFYSVVDARAERTVVWYVTAPPGMPRVPLPQLPPPYDDWAPIAGSYTELLTTLVDNDGLATYRAVRETRTSLIMHAEADRPLPGETRETVASGYISY